ncbi:hypothetical protein GCM10023310_19100 [Paenibacillus vulneris]
MVTVLVVDDDSEIRDVIHVYLRNEGYHVIEAANGLEALELLKSNPVHLIILDVMMPRMDGIKTCLKIRETSMLPIIMLSAKEEDIDKITGLTIGADDYGQTVQSVGITGPGQSSVKAANAHGERTGCFPNPYSGSDYR